MKCLKGVTEMFEQTNFGKGYTNVGKGLHKYWKGLHKCWKGATQILDRNHRNMGKGPYKCCKWFQKCWKEPTKLLESGNINVECSIGYRIIRQISPKICQKCWLLYVHFGIYLNHTAGF